MLEFARRTPQQQRALTSRACILEATAQLLDRRDGGSVTTNHVAERAGVSIGTLYRYFRNKDDIFEALARSEMRKIVERGMWLIRDEKITQASKLMDGFAEITVTVFNERPLVRRNLHDLIGSRSPITKEIHLNRLRFGRLIGEKLVQLEQERFRVLQREERRYLVMAWRAIVNEAVSQDVSRFNREQIKRLLVGTVLSFSEKN